MEDARYWMWPKRKSSSLGSQIRASTNPNLYGVSWEEQAFAEDASGALGGCIWPPRSYSCSFCRREFRSAQALGGHMNVHRRDRARLKQSQSPNSEILHHQNSYNHGTSPSTSSQVCTFVYNHNSDIDLGCLASPSSPSRVLVKPSQLNCDENAFLPLFSNPIVQESNKRALFGNRSYHIPDLKKEEKNSKILEPRCKVSKGDGNYLKADLSVSLNLFVCQSDEKEEAMSCKRQRTDSTSSFFVKQSSKVIELGPNLIEGLDLELRLGENPKVK